MLSCRDAQKRLAEAEVLPLSLPGRISLRMHLLLCRLCRRHRRQLETVDRVVRGIADGAENALPPDGPALSPEARERIRASLRNA
jgi:hypothetical protein